MTSPDSAAADARKAAASKDERKPPSGWRKAALIAIFCLATLAVTVATVRFGQNWLDRTKTISFFVSRDGPDRKFAEKFAKIMAGNNEFIRIAVTPSDDPVGAFARRECDFVVARSDLKLPGWARSVANLEKEIIRQVISANAEEAIEAHAVRTRYAGRTTFIDFHLVVPGAMTVERSHAICDRLEAALTEAMDEGIVTIHVEPEDKAEHKGVRVA